jgi:hypothetical protein
MLLLRTLSKLLLLVMTLATAQELTPLDNNVPQRQLKSSKSFGGIKKKRNTNNNNANNLQFYVLRRDELKNKIESKDSFVVAINVYKRGTTQVAGQLFQQLSFTNKARTEGVGTGVLTINKVNMISFAIVVGQFQYAITGGSGAYANCAGGYLEATGGTSEQIDFHVVFSGSC